MLNSLGNSQLANLNPFILFLILLWSLVWKGFALWKSARNNQKGWYVCLLVLNTLGIAEIVYILAFQRNRNAEKSKTTKKSSKT